jgi:hypothetical protein
LALWFSGKLFLAREVETLDHCALHHNLHYAFFSRPLTSSHLDPNIVSSVNSQYEIISDIDHRHLKAACVVNQINRNELKVSCY